MRALLLLSSDSLLSSSLALEIHVLPHYNQLDRQRRVWPSSSVYKEPLIVLSIITRGCHIEKEWITLPLNTSIPISFLNYLHNKENGPKQVLKTVLCIFTLRYKEQIEVIFFFLENSI